MVLLLWRRDLNRMDSYRVRTVWLLALSWRMMGLCTTKCRRFLLCSCDYDLFAKVKGPLRGTRYNKKDEHIRAIGRSIQNTSKEGCAVILRRLPNIWLKMINMERWEYWRYINVAITPVNKAMTEIPNCCHHFFTTPVLKWGRGLIGISGYLIWLKKTWWNWYLNPVVNFCEVRSPQLAKSTLLTSTLVPLGSFQIL